MSSAPVRTRAANFAFLLLLPALFLVIVSLTRHLAPGNPFYGALDALGSTPQWQVVSAVFTAATLLGLVGAVALCVLGIVRLDWHSEGGSFVATVQVRARLWPLFTLGLSLSLLGILVLYAFFENFVPR